jgi:hypothetical protein
MSDARFEKLLEYIQELNITALSEAAKRSLNRVNQHLSTRSVGFITANRLKKPGSVDGKESEVRVSTAENRSNNKSLEHDIRKAGYSFIRVKGGYPEVDKDGKKQAGASKYEPSYIVVGPKGDDGGKLKSFLTQHGSKYSQDAVLYKHHSSPHIHSISTSDRDKEFPRGQEQPLGGFKAGKFGEYFTALHGDADSSKPRAEMSPEEREAHKQASLRKKSFVFESFEFEFSEDEDSPVPRESLTYYARLSEHERNKKTKD